MWLAEGNLDTRVDKASDDEEKWLQKFLSFSGTDARFTGKDRLFNVFARSFPSGLLPQVKKAAQAAGMEVQVFDRRTNVLKVDPDADLAWLRDYQREAVDRAVVRRRGILWLPTGAGKTEIAFGITRAMPGRWLFLVHRNTLMDQTADRYMKRSPLETVGRVGDGRWDFDWRCDNFVCATFQSVAAAMKSGDPRATKLLHGADGIIIDECHVLPAESFLRVSLETMNAPTRIGLSGTPLARGDRRSALAVASLGPLIHRIRPETLIAKGVLAKPFVRMVRCAQSSDKVTWAGAYADLIVKSTKRNALIVKAIRSLPQPCMIFVKEEKHGKNLEKALIQAGIPSRFIYGKTSPDGRKTAVRDLVAGRIEAMVCSVVFQEGVDIPEVRSVIIASGGKSTIAAIQRVGRGMRVEAGKVDFTVIDIADEGCGCDSPLVAGDDTVEKHPGCKWLEKHTRERRGAYRSEGYNVSTEDWP